MKNKSVSNIFNLRIFIYTFRNTTSKPDTIFIRQPIQRYTQSFCPL